MGKFVIALAIVIGVAATNTGNNLLYLVLGGLFGLIASSGVLSERVLKGLDPLLELPEFAIAGRETVVGVVVAAHPSLDSHLIWVELLDAAGAVLGKTLLRELSAGTRRRVYVRLKPERRGALHLAEVRFTTRYPFQMYEKRRRVTRTATLWVAPAPLLTPLPPRGARDQGSDDGHRRSGGDSGEFQGLRERIDSDPPSRIHWRRSAAAGMPLAKTFAAVTEPTLELYVRAGADAAQFEAALATVAGWLGLARAAGVPVRLHLGTHTIEAGAGGSMAAAQIALARAERAALPRNGPVLEAGYR